MLRNSHIRLGMLFLASAVAASCAGSEDGGGATPEPAALTPVDEETVYFCPMDLDVRSNEMGFCSRCGMALIAGMPDPLDYEMELALTPETPRAGETTRLDFTIRDPWEQRLVSNFEIVHEKIFHLFVMSQDLEYFGHEHPVDDAQGGFSIDLELPKPGLYQVLADFYPEGGTPQLIARSFIVPGGTLGPATLESDYGTPMQGENLTVELVTEPAVPIAGQETEMYFTVTPSEGLEPYIGAWGHMLAVSDDMIDTVHGHPFIADGGSEMLFHLLFPRARTYRVWVQFQREGVVNTVHFDIPVQELTF